MILQEIKSNINKIDYELKSLFEIVNIDELSIGNKYFFEIKSQSSILENSGYKTIDVIVRIDKREITNDLIKWIYCSNPLVENNTWVERYSSIENISNDIFDILENKKLDNEYLESLEVKYELITESNSFIEDTLVDSIKDILEKYNISVYETEDKLKPIYENLGFPVSVEQTIIIPHESDIKMSNKFMIEQEIKSLSNVNWVLFKEGFIEINITI